MSFAYVFLFRFLDYRSGGGAGSVVPEATPGPVAAGGPGRRLGGPGGRRFSGCLTNHSTAIKLTHLCQNKERPRPG